MHRLVWEERHVAEGGGLVKPVIDVLRGGLIGIAEVIPGVSGGTVALIVGVYQSIISSASAVVKTILSGVVPRLRTTTPWSAIEWSRLIPLLIGMVAAIFLAARFLEPVLERYPAETRALFAGLIVMSLWVPIRMVGSRWRGRDVVVAAVSAAFSFVLVGFPSTTVGEPEWWVVMPAAAVAVCALVLPGVSGSFLLLTVGMYEPTIRAVNDFDVSYLSAFIAGAILGLGAFVTLLQWLLTNRRRVTLVVMSGLMVGSLRALWPWQSEQRNLLAPDPSQLPLVVGLFLGGIAVVATLIVIEARLSRASSPGQRS